jgi:organic radical activating enzyme
MTGGEPLLDKNTFRVLEYVISNPRPDLEICITTNASVPEDNWNKFVDLVSFIMDKKMLKRFRLFVSVDAWGKEAEYIRYGLNFEKLWYNANNFLSRIDEGLLTFIITTNIFSIFSIQKLMENILYLQRVHNINKVKRKEETSSNLQYYGFHRVFLDTPVLMYPTWQSLQLAPKELWHYLDDCLEFMNQNKDNGRSSRWVGFKDHQIDRFDRAIKFMKQGFDTDTELAESIQNFKLFFTEHDKRRGTSIKDVFPELTKVMQI